MRGALLAGGLAALVALLLFGVFGAMFGAMLGAGAVRGAPALLGLLALAVLVQGPRALPAAAAWAVLGAVAAVALRAGTGWLGTDGWLPSEDHSRAERLLEAAWCLVVAWLAWRGAVARWTGPLVAACVATTRIGGFGQAFVPILFEDTLHDALLVAVNILAGLAAGVMVLLLAGWGLAILVRIPARWAPPGRVLAGLAAAAGIGHMLQL
jgi:hypothetical protein